MNENAMIECIREESEVINEILKNKDTYTKEFVTHFKNHDVKRVYLSGHGSPYNVGGVLRFMIEQLLHVEVSVDYASLFNHHLSFNANGIYKSEEMVLICPAQSGRTSGPVDAAKKAQELHIPVICTTLLKEGILAQNSNIVIHKQSGEEESFPETKGHIASLAILLLCVLETAHELNKIDEESYLKYLEAFHQMPTFISEIIDKSEKWYDENRKLLLAAHDLTFIGYGENYATAIEGSLKILETTLKPCLSYECEEYMHGQNQPVNEKSVIFMIASQGKECHRVQALAKWCREKGAHVIVIGNQSDMTLIEDDLAIPVHSCAYLSTIEYLIPFQVISYYMAKDMGLSSVVANHDDAGKELGVRYE